VQAQILAKVPAGCPGVGQPAGDQEPAVETPQPAEPLGLVIRRRSAPPANLTGLASQTCAISPTFSSSSRREYSLPSNLATNTASVASLRAAVQNPQASRWRGYVYHTVSSLSTFQDSGGNTAAKRPWRISAPFARHGATRRGCPAVFVAWRSLCASTMCSLTW